jgi:hypothetical protein
MNWFEKHLNWTLLMIPVVSIISGFMSGFIFHYFSPERTYIVLFPTQPGFFITAILDTVGVIYVFNKKNRDRRFVFFFIPLLVVAVIGQIPIHSELTYSRDNQVLFVVALSCTFLWIIGWIILLFLKNHDKQRESGTKCRFIRYLYLILKPIRHHPKILYLSLASLFIIIVVLGILAGNSYYSNDFTYTVSDGHVNTPSETLYFSFERPECFDIFPTGSVIFEGLYPRETGINLARSRRKWFHEYTEDYIRIRISREDSTRFTPDINIVEKAVVAYCGNHREKYSFEILEHKTMIVDKIPADYVVIFAERKQEKRSIETFRFIHFYNYGLVWTITMRCEGRENERNTEFFEHLAESFTVSPSETLTENRSQIER